MRKVTHKQIYKKHPWGGEINSTLCNRVSHADKHGTNVTINNNEVTCKFCKSMLSEQ